MLCKFERVIYPRGVTATIADFMIAIYKPCGTLRDAAGNVLSSFKAVGYCLPTAPEIRYRMAGKWTKTAAHGIQFEVERYEEVILPTKEGIIAYLSSGQIKGVGKGLAEKIYNAFGTATLNVLDKDPKQLLTIPGIGEKSLQKISDSYLASRGARDVIAFLAPHGISPNRAIKLYQEYGAETMEIVRKHPYRLCEISGIAFLTADKLAMSMGLDRISPERVDEALLYALIEAEESGHCCMEKHAFLKNTLKLLDTPGITKDMAAGRAFRLVQAEKLISFDDSVFLNRADRAESGLACAIAIKQKELSPVYERLDASIAQEELSLKFRLAAEQRDAIKMALTNKLSVITGGPGTGKTSVQKALLDLYHQKYPDAKIICCAPTGKAARRMEQSTGFPACTVHKALGLTADNLGRYGEPDILDAELVLVDEVSMLDIYLAQKLFQAVPKGCRIVLVGDSEQLPSVGPGIVLKEIIASGKVPVVRLDQVFRQQAGSRIAINARLIRHGNLSLEYGPDFVFHQSANLTASADILEALYLQEVAKYGIDNVIMLTPYRQKTETGVNAMNQRLQAKINPPAPGKPEAVKGNKIFRLGDKVMQIRNAEDVSNGDVGYITCITGIGHNISLKVDFGDERIVEYESSDLDMLDLAYTSTVHKSQGGEYKSVIINLQCAHYVMLMRPLIYTAITRAKEQVHIVGERKALCIAIKRTDAEKRGTKLAERIQNLLN